MVWRHRFDITIANQLTTTKNPNGQLSINELELAALIQAYPLARHHYPTQTGGTLLCATDNIGVLFPPPSRRIHLDT
jgi:hypothetical protein